MYYNNDDQARDAEIAQSLAEAEYAQYAALAEHERMLSEMNAEASFYSDLAKGILNGLFVSYHFDILDALQDGRARESDLEKAFNDIDTVAHCVASIKKIEIAAIQREAERTGIDLSKMTENQLRNMKDYYLSILSSVS